jgi:hypothetical protein
MLLTGDDTSIRLRCMDTCRLEKLKEERADLMKLTIKELQQELTDDEIHFDLESTKFSLVDQLVSSFYQDQRKEIIMICTATTG